MDKSFGYVNTGSTSSLIRIVARETAAKTPVVGRAVVLDLETEEGTYRALGTVSDIATHNDSMKNSNLKQFSASAQGANHGASFGKDVREINIKIQATYKYNKTEERWDKASSALPTSPPTNSDVKLLDEEILQELIKNETNITHIGTMRGLQGVPAPLTVPNFSNQRGAVHSAVIGRSGSGKTAFATYMLANQMSNANHAIIVVDPQGQWSNENGFVFSLQKFAQSLGRDVTTLRVSEDIRLPMNEELLSQLLEYANVWAKMRRMAAENRKLFSDEVVSLIAWEDGAADKKPRELLSKVFKKIANSNSTLTRVYAKGGETVENLRKDLLMLAGEPITNDEGEIEEVTEDEQESVENNWRAILSKFTPIINLFSSKNLQGGKRHNLGGDTGFLSGVMKSRDENETAPYVILDMSTNTKVAAQDSYSSKTGNRDEVTSMKKLLDNVDIKAIIVSTILEQIKVSSEEAFAQGGANLNTQIVFDEAWRYAPNVSSSASLKPIDILSTQLEGFALDTRKYGIGWTYILQSPSDLNRGIWKQLSFVYTGYGIIGSDKRILGELMDESDRQAHIGLYDQFSPPSSTGIYPFMMNGPISPLIFTNTPIFVDVYNTVESFLFDNQHWIDFLCKANGKAPISSNPNAIRLQSVKGKIVKSSKISTGTETPVKKFKVHGNTDISVQESNEKAAVSQHKESIKNSSIQQSPF